jgi:hypothetical protein
LKGVMSKLRAALAALKIHDCEISGTLAKMFKMSQAISARKLSEFIIASFGLIALLAAQWLLTFAIPGTQYSQPDGKMAQAVIHTALKYGGIFQLNNINPLQGFGSQLQPHNVWVNPAYWPFAIIDSPLALEVSALVALGCLAFACYLLARCFDVPALPSIVAAQLSIILFGPLAYMLVFYQVFWINPGIAVVYAPQLVALGILGRLEPGRMRNFILATGGMFALLLYSLTCDPLWAMIIGIGLLGAFAVVALSPLHVRAVLVRCAALCCCLVLLLISGAIGYVYTLSEYSTRVWFSDELAYVPQAFLASIMFISPKTAGSYYSICALGWLLGILFARGRVRVLGMAGLVSFVILVAYSTTFLLMLKWWWPLPLYVEHSLFPLFTIAAVAGYWAVLRQIKLVALRPGVGIFHIQRLALGGGLSALLVAAFVPAAAAIYAVRAGPTAPHFDEPFPDEPELVRYFRETIGLRVGGEFRGSVMMYVAPNVADVTMFNLWMWDIPTANEYSQLVTPQALYLNAALFKRDIGSGGLNHFVPWIGKTGSYDVLFKTLQTLGVRYIARYAKFQVDQRHLPFVIMPRRPVGDEPADWFVYQFPNPNLGNYSPTEVVTAKSGAEIIAALGAPHFDFTKRVVLSSAIDEPLVPAHNMRVSLIRGGLHVTGTSEGTSLALLPQQFSHCLRARDTRVRLVRANLLMTGMIFSGRVDTDIVSDYGIFSPGCRRIDLADLRQIIDLPVPPRQPMLVDWDGAVARFRELGVAIGVLNREAPPESTPPEEPAPSGPIITAETVLAALPQPTTSGFTFIGIQGLNAEVKAGEEVLPGHSILRLVAVPTAGRHYLAAQSKTLKKNKIYRITAWVKGPAGVKVEMQVSDELKPNDGTPANYGSAIFNPAAGTVSSASGRLKGRGIEQGPEGWQKTWVDLTTAGGEFVLAFALISKDRSEFTGDGQLGLSFGGIEVAERN